MPFQDDTGINIDEHRGPLWSAFAIFGSQLERMIVLNMSWSLQLIPAMAAFVLVELPTAVRMLMLVYTLVAILPATVVLYGVCAHAADEDMITLDLVTDVFRTAAWPGTLALAPLWGSLGLVGWLAQRADAAGLLAVSVVLQTGLLLLLLAANYWGPLLIVYPKRPGHEIFVIALRLVWRYPVPALLLSAAVLVTGVIGAISVGGLFLAIPVVVALLQTQMMRRMMSRRMK